MYFPADKDDIAEAIIAFQNAGFPLQAPKLSPSICKLLA